MYEEVEKGKVKNVCKGIGNYTFLYKKFERWPNRFSGIVKYDKQIKNSMDKLNKLDTAKEKVSELEEELKENNRTKTQRVRNMENTEGKGCRGYGQKA